jgi:hypothetical protein
MELLRDRGEQQMELLRQAEKGRTEQRKQKETEEQRGTEGAKRG